MRMYLHIGTEKTGSSFAQMLFARNRKILQESGIFFPKAGNREADMLEGRISPGNGKELYEALHLSKKGRVRALLGGYLAEAKKRRCTAILLSNENLILPFSNKRHMDDFLAVCQDLKLEKPSFLLVVRDPVGQALSLFRHRAKNGRIAEIDKWIREGYSLNFDLDNILDRFVEHGLDFRIRKYKNSSSFLSNVFFNDWLKIKEINVGDALVNPSLTLSELYLLRKLRRYDKILVGELYSRLLSIPFDQKAEDKQMNEYCQVVINNYLADFHEVWNRCNQFLAPNEQLQLPKKRDDSTLTNALKLDLSDAQVETVIKLLSDASSAKFLLKKSTRLVRGRISKIIGYLRNLIK